MLNTPHIDWFGLSPVLTLIGASFVSLLCAVLVPRACAARRGHRRRGGRLHRRNRPRRLALRRQRGRPHDRGRRLLPRPLDLARPDHHLRRRARHDAPRGGAHPRLAPRRRPRAARRPRGGVLRAPPRLGGRDGVLHRRREPDHALPLARVVLDRALRHVRDRLRPRGLARGGAQVPRRRLVRRRHPPLRLGARLRRHGAGRVQRHRLDDRVAGPHGRRVRRRRDRADGRGARLQDVGRAVPHVDARRLRGRADDGDRLDVVGDEGRGAPAHVPRDDDGVPARTSTSGAGPSRSSRRSRSRSATSRRSCRRT